MAGSAEHVLVADRDLLEQVLGVGVLSGADAARIAATCRAFRDVLSPSEGALWRGFFEAEYGNLGAQFSTSTSWFQRYRIARQRCDFSAARWTGGGRGRQPNERVSGTPGARQGAASCAFTHNAEPMFLVYGGWTEHGIGRDLSLIHI